MWLGIWCYLPRMSFIEIIQSSPWLPAVVGAVVATVAILVFLTRTPARTLATERKIAELGVSTSGLTQAQSEVLGQIKAMATTTATLQAALTGTLNERLDAVSGQMRQSLESTSLRTAESLGELRKHLNKIDEAQRNITELSSQVVNLQDLLANKQARGAFGEVQLNDIVRNILPPSAYDLQKTLSNGLRPDCLIRLPNPPGPIAVDAKFPLESFQALRQARTDPDRLIATRKFKADMQKHLRDIASRYIVAGETAESAIMFIPSEAVYAEIHGSLADIVDESYRLRVWIVSPTTMWALLNTVRAVLKDVQMREQADVIQAQVGLLLGTHLASTTALRPSNDTSARRSTTCGRFGSRRTKYFAGANESVSFSLRTAVHPKRTIRASCPSPRPILGVAPTRRPNKFPGICGRLISLRVQRR